MSSYLSHNRRKRFQRGVAAFDIFGNRSRTFDAVNNDYIVLPNTRAAYKFIQETKLFTVSSWIKIDSSVFNSGGFHVFSGNKGGTSSDNGFVFAFDDRGTGKTNSILFYINHGAGGTSYDILLVDSVLPNDGQWHHIAVSGGGAGGNITLYIDGILIPAATSPIAFTGSYVDSDYDLQIGNWEHTAHGMLGGMADFRIYNNELSSLDISNLYNGTNITTDLIGHWLIDSDDVIDHAGTNNGTNFGSVYSTDSPS